MEKQMTKAQLIEKINEFATRFMGSPTELWGLKSEKLADLQKRYNNYLRMDGFTRTYLSMKMENPISTQQSLAYDLMGDLAPEWYNTMYQVRFAAMAIWRHQDWQ